MIQWLILKTILWANSHPADDLTVSATLKDRQRKAKTYALLRRLGWLMHTFLELGTVAILLSSGWAQRYSTGIGTVVHPWPAQVLLTIGSVWLGLAVLSFPLDVWRGFYLERRFGLSTQRFSQWLMDHFKGLAVASILGIVVVEGLAFLLRIDPAGWWRWTAFIWIVWSVGLTHIAPKWLIPIFYRQKPLTDPELDQRLKRFVKRCGVPVRAIFEVNLSRTTQKANACLCGLGTTRRILMSDTLVNHYPPEEIEVVLAHELGHHRLNHIGILTVASAAGIGLSCWVVDRWIKIASPLSGLQISQDSVTLLAIGLGLGVAQLGLMPILNGLSRYLEAQADRFALRMTGNPSAFVAVMRRLADQNLAEVDPPRWVEWFFYDHPPIAKRIAMAQSHA
jgi:STE24 endopeptidase